MTAALINRRRPTLNEFLSIVRKAIDKYGMIDEGDCIAVGVSGGKDSLCLLAALGELKRFYPKKFTLKAIMVDPCFFGKPTDYSEIIELCRRLYIEPIIRTTELYEIIFEVRKESNPCSMCARMRRGILHDTAKAAGCNKIALGHNTDDAVETFFMNLLQGGKIGCFQPVTYLSRKDITMIRPLIYVSERQTANTAKKLHLPVIKSPCPADGNTSREQAKLFAEDLDKRLSAHLNGAASTVGPMRTLRKSGKKQKARAKSSPKNGGSAGAPCVLFKPYLSTFAQQTLPVR